MQRLNKRKIALFVLPMILFAASLPITIESTVVPAWSIQVTDQQGNPIQGALVRQIWQNYSIEDQGHEQDLRSDNNGQVSFPRRTIRASIFTRTIHPILNALQQGVHASFGVDASIGAFADDRDGWVYYHPHEPLPEQVVLHKSLADNQRRLRENGT
jgi:hypothetical protein